MHNYALHANIWLVQGVRAMCTQLRWIVYRNFYLCGKKMLGHKYFSCLLSCARFILCIVCTTTRCKLICCNSIWNGGFLKKGAVNAIRSFKLYVTASGAGDIPCLSVNFTKTGPGKPGLACGCYGFTCRCVCGEIVWHFVCNESLYDVWIQHQVAKRLQSC